MKADRMSALRGAAASLALLAAGVAPVGAAPNPFPQAVAWQQRHAVTVRVADLSNPAQRGETARRLKAVHGVAFVEFDLKRNQIRIIPWENEPLDPLAIRQVVGASGYDVVAVSSHA